MCMHLELVHRWAINAQRECAQNKSQFSFLLAVQSIIDLGGRFFGGRTVAATFFNEDRFDKQDLAPKAGELN